ncbi:MAG: response regulator [Pseudomonadota bacterium]
MMSADDIDVALPYLRRYARAVTGSARSGDTYVVTLLTRLREFQERPSDAERPKEALFRLLNSLLDDSAQSDANIAGVGRRALLLTAVEGFSLNAVGRILSYPPEGVDQLVLDAETALKSELRTTVLIIEDEPLIAANLAQIAGDLGHKVVGTAATASDAISLASATRPGILLVDVQLADGSSGIDAVSEITKQVDIPCIFITAYPERLLTGLGAEPAFLISKPFKPLHVASIISQALVMREAA